MIHSTEQRKHLEAKTCFKLIVVDLEASCLGPTESGELRCKFEGQDLDLSYGLPRWLRGKESIRNAGDEGLIPWSGRFTWRRKWQPTPLFLPGKFHG